jgi:hypothetical protein
MAHHGRKRSAKPTRVIICFRGDPELREQIRVAAERAERTQSDYLRLLVKDAMGRQTSREPAA